MSEFTLLLFVLTGCLSARTDVLDFIPDLFYNAVKRSDSR